MQHLAALFERLDRSTATRDKQAAIAVFLGSDESRMVNGTTIAADGGRSTVLKVSVD